MTIPTRLAALSTTFLPVDQARQVLLPPVRAARVSAVAMARTARHWELLLEGAGSPSDAASDVPETSGPQDDKEHDQHAGPKPVSSDLPVADWPELSYADAQARLGTCDAADLRILLSYEESHGHRPQYVALLEQRGASRL